MSILKRHYSDGQTYFITNVTYRLRPILREDSGLLMAAIHRTQAKLRFDLLAYVVIPDHFHLLFYPGEDTPADILHRIKLSFGADYRKKHNLRGGRVWQSRFWDHVIRDERDLRRHIDYIHYNPVKHGLVNRPFDWAPSSIHNFMKEGYYGLDWGVKEKLEFKGEFGDA